MLREEMGLIRWLGKELIVVFALFFIIPALIILALAGMITGVTWKIMLGVVLAYIAFFIVAKMVIHFYLKKLEREHHQIMRKESEVKYVIIK